jgi:hypothetical protein
VQHPGLPGVSLGFRRDREGQREGDGEWNGGEGRGQPFRWLFCGF